MKRKPKRRWSLWVHKETGMYFDPTSLPKLGGRQTAFSDFEWVEVIEETLNKEIEMSTTNGKGE